MRSLVYTGGAAIRNMAVIKAKGSSTVTSSGQRTFRKGDFRNLEASKEAVTFDEIIQPHCGVSVGKNSGKQKSKVISSGLLVSC